MDDLSDVCALFYIKFVHSSLQQNKALLHLLFAGKKYGITNSIITTKQNPWP
jgi:hypothetical protein